MSFRSVALGVTSSLLAACAAQGHREAPVSAPVSLSSASSGFTPMPMRSVESMMGPSVAAKTKDDKALRVCMEDIISHVVPAGQAMKADGISAGRQQITMASNSQGGFDFDLLIVAANVNNGVKGDAIMVAVGAAHGKVGQPVETMPLPVSMIGGSRKYPNAEPVKMDVPVPGAPPPSAEEVARTRELSERTFNGIYKCNLQANSLK